MSDTTSAELVKACPDTAISSAPADTAGPSTARSSATIRAPKVAREITMNGVVYASENRAAIALGVHQANLSKLLRQGLTPDQAYERLTWLRDAKLALQATKRPRAKSVAPTAVQASVMPRIVSVDTTVPLASAKVPVAALLPIAPPVATVVPVVAPKPVTKATAKVKPKPVNKAGLAKKPSKGTKAAKAATEVTEAKAMAWPLPAQPNNALKLKPLNATKSKAPLTRTPRPGQAAGFMGQSIQIGPKFFTTGYEACLAYGNKPDAVRLRLLRGWNRIDAVTMPKGAKKPGSAAPAPASAPKISLKEALARLTATLSALVHAVLSTATPANTLGQPQAPTLPQLPAEPVPVEPVVVPVPVTTPVQVEPMEPAVAVTAPVPVPVLEAASVIVVEPPVVVPVPAPAIVAVEPATTEPVATPVVAPVIASTPAPAPPPVAFLTTGPAPGLQRKTPKARTQPEPVVVPKARAKKVAAVAPKVAVQPPPLASMPVPEELVDSQPMPSPRRARPDAKILDNADYLSAVTKEGWQVQRRESDSILLAKMGPNDSGTVEIAELVRHSDKHSDNHSETWTCYTAVGTIAALESVRSLPVTVAGFVSKLKFVVKGESVIGDNLGEAMKGLVPPAPVAPAVKLA